MICTGIEGCTVGTGDGTVGKAVAKSENENVVTGEDTGTINVGFTAGALNI